MASHSRSSPPRTTVGETADEPFHAVHGPAQLSPTVTSKVLLATPRMRTAARPTWTPLTVRPGPVMTVSRERMDSSSTPTVGFPAS